MGSKQFKRLCFIILALISSMMIIPLINVVATSFSTDLGSMRPGVILWPDEWNLEGYRTLFTRLEFFRPFSNTMMVTIIGTTIHVIMASAGGFVLAQNNLPGKKVITTIILLTMTIPSQVIMVPLFIVFRDFQLLNTLTSLVISGLVSGFSILLMRTFFLRIPYSLVEAAKIDGASSLMIFRRIYLPLTVPGLLTVGLFDVVSKYNMFTEPLLYINDPAKITLQVALRSIIMSDFNMNSSDLVTNNVIMAAIVVALIPLVIFYPYIQRYLIKGMHSGAEKG